MNKRFLHIWVTVGAFVVAAVGGPMFINCLYKRGPGWVTAWEAPDMLAYYGTILGAAVTAFSLVLTISFTRRQLERDRFLERSTERWGRVESVIIKALEAIDPLNIWDFGTSAKSAQDACQSHIANAQLYTLRAKTSLDLIKSHISPKEYEKIAELGVAIQEAIRQFCEIAEAVETNYCTLQASADGHEPIDDNILRQFDEKMIACAAKIVNVRNDQYQRLLDMRRDVFDRVYAEVEEEAGQLLLFKKRK